MKDNEITSLFSNVGATAVNEQAKARAVRAAMAKFSLQVNAAGFQESAMSAQENAAGANGYAEQCQGNNNQKNNNQKNNSQKNNQGFWSRLRPMFKRNSEQWRKYAMKFQTKAVLSGVAGVAVCAFVFFTVDYSAVPDIATPDSVRPNAESQASESALDSDKEQRAKQVQPATTDLPTTVKSDVAITEKFAASQSNKSTRQESDSVGAVPASAPLIAESLHATSLVNKKVAPALMMAPRMLADAAVTQPQYQGRDKFEHVDENGIKRVSEAPVSTFSVDVDTASYSFVRASLNRGVLPQKEAVRIEEMVNYFDYQYPLPTSKTQPFKPTIVVTDSPWKPGNKLIHVGIKGYDLAKNQRKKANIVFLLDVSGSMNQQNKLPLVKQSMSLLLNSLQPDDTIAIAVYAGAAGTVLPPTPVKEKMKILAALNGLSAGGSTAGGEGIALAYQLAEQNFDKSAVNRIFLATDGDFNVGISSTEALKGFVERKREKGIFLSVLGFGQGNYQDQLMQALAQNGNGVAAYIDTLGEAQKVLVTEASASLFTIAKDVKIQMEFNPATVAEYRLIGYETRALKQEDFNNDVVDAGDIGAGHTVTAIYEITPVGAESSLLGESRYSAAADTRATGVVSEYGFLKIRYKLPEAKVSTLISEIIPVHTDAHHQDAALMQDVHFATAVAGFGQLLKGSKFAAQWQYDDAITLAQASKGDDAYGYRTELVQLIRKAKIAQAM